MRFAMAAGFLLSSVIAASAQTPAAATPPAPTYNIPAGSKPQTVVTKRGDLSVGQVNPVRQHPGIEMGIVAQGALEFWFNDKPSHVYRPGEAFFIARGEHYQVRTVGAVPVIVYTTLVTDAGEPDSVEVDGPPLIH